MASCLDVSLALRTVICERGGQPARVYGYTVDGGAPCNAACLADQIVETILCEMKRFFINCSGLIVVEGILWSLQW